MKRLTSLALSIVMLLSGIIGIQFVAYAAGWGNNYQNIDINSTYTDFASNTDVCVSGEYYDAFRFSVPARGKVHFNVEYEDYDYRWCFYWVYSTNDLNNDIWHFGYDYISINYSTGRGVYYYDKEDTTISLDAGEYFFVVSYCNIDDLTSDYTFSLDYTPTFSNSSISKLTAKKKAFKVKWKKASSITGYEIQYSLKKNMKSSKKIKIKNSASTSKTIKKLKAKKKYYVRIRTYKTVNINGTNTTYYGKWSSKKTVTTKK